MGKQEILRKAFIKAKQNGWNSQGYEYIVISFDKDALPPVIIFSHDFAKALGFKLSDLGRWCDEGKEPLDFIKLLL